MLFKNKPVKGFKLYRIWHFGTKILYKINNLFLELDRAIIDQIFKESMKDF